MLRRIPLRRVTARAAMAIALALGLAVPTVGLGDDVKVTGRLVAHGYDADGTHLWSSEVFENLVTSKGKNYFQSKGNSSAAYGSGAITGLLVGNGTTAPTTADTGLAATTANSYYAALDAGFPTLNEATSTETYQFTLTTAQGNGAGSLAHNEFGLTNATSLANVGNYAVATPAGAGQGVLITHLLAGPFTKSSAVSIVYIYTLTVS